MQIGVDFYEEDEEALLETIGGFKVLETLELHECRPERYEEGGFLDSLGDACPTLMEISYPYTGRKWTRENAEDIFELQPDEEDSDESDDGLA